MDSFEGGNGSEMDKRIRQVRAGGDQPGQLPLACTSHPGERAGAQHLHRLGHFPSPQTFCLHLPAASHPEGSNHNPSQDLFTLPRSQSLHLAWQVAHSTRGHSPEQVTRLVLASKLARLWSSSAQRSPMVF